MNFNKRVNGSWVDTPHYIHNTSTDTITTLPAVLYPNAVTATVGLKGNMQQTGTPSPDNPIQPSECGERTGNLFIQKLTGVTINSLGEIVSDANYDTYIAEVSDGETYTVSNVTGIQVFGFFTTKPALGTITYNSSRTIFSTSSQTLTVPTGENIKYIGVRYNTGVSNAMFNLGETALPYEPQGIKIPILSASTTTPVYLGEVQSTRRIRKYEVTGQETGWRIHQSLQSWFQLILSDSVVSGFELCTHYKPSPNAPATIQNGEILVNFDGANNRAIIRDTTYTTLDDFKIYLQQQYANGTPVTIWYVLATPETGIINEPIRKIGDYADTVSGITIPTIAGANSFDVLTTLKPSEATVNYKGWHPVSSVHERESGAWT